MVQEEECLFRRRKALSSNFNTIKKEKKLKIKKSKVLEFSLKILKNGE
jgi:hypothetical protein